MEALAAGAAGCAGLAFAAAILTRPPLAVVAAVTGLWQSWTRRSLRPAIEIGALSSVALYALLRYSHAFWQGGLDSQYTAAGGGFVGPFFDFGPAGWGRLGLNILGTLLSPSRGILFGSPFLIVLAPGLRAAWRSGPPWARAAACGGVLYLIIQLKGNRFSGGERFWSYRYPLETLTLLAPLLVISWRDWASRTPHRRAAFFSLVCLSGCLQAIGALCFRGPYAGHPWVPLDLIAALIGHRGILGCGLLVAGCFGSGILYRRIRLDTAAQPASE
jgi:hypothetical protein